MKLATLARGAHEQAGAVIGEEVLDFAMATALLPIARWIPASLAALIAGEAEGLAIVRRLVDRVAGAGDAVMDDLRATGALVPLAEARLLAPLPRPTILLSHARAYREHVAEMARGDTPPGHPVGFMKNGHAVIGPNAPIPLPPSAAGMVDFEGEISIVFGKPCHGVAASEALDHVVGVTIVNDVSARDWVPEMKTQPDRNRMGKQFPGFAPMGPWIVTTDEIADMADLHLVTRVNGEVMQDARTRDLIWSIPELIEYYSRWYPFRPGDVMTTGSPAGVGYARDPRRFLGRGDVVEIEVDGVGTLRNRIGG